jgi:hypothetical protein
MSNAQLIGKLHAAHVLVSEVMMELSNNPEASGICEDLNKLNDIFPDIADRIEDELGL